MEETDHEIIANMGKHLEFDRGDLIYNQGDRPTGLYFIRTGLVGLVAVSKEGNEHLLRLFRAGDFFGHRSLLAEEQYHASARALQKTELVFLTADQFQSCVQKHPQILFGITQKMAIELRRAEESRVTITDHDVLTRTAEALVYLKDIHPDHNWTRQEIADFCDSTAPTIVRTLSKLEERKLISLDGRSIQILDREGLLNLA